MHTDGPNLPTRLPDYFPPAVGRYEVKPGLVRFGKPLGGRAADGHVFQFDSTFPAFRANTLAARRERLDKYFATRDYHPAVQRAVARFIATRLAAEHPDLFTLDHDVLACSLTAERLVFDDSFDLRRVESEVPVEPAYRCALDALACQVPEDLAVVSTAPGAAGNGPRHWLSALHVTAPNSWAPEEKVGGTFAAIHEPVAGMGQMNAQGPQLVGAMTNARDGLVRFAWGVTWDDALNHHPVRPPGRERAAAFDPTRPRAFLRIERQTVWGFPEIGAALFTIRPYLYDVAEIRKDSTRRANLASAIESMSDASLRYKGMAWSRDALLGWINAERGCEPQAGR